MSSLLPRFFIALAVLLTLVGCSANDEPGALLAAALDASVNDSITPAPPVVSAGTDDAAKASVLAAYVAMEQAAGKTDARYHLARTGEAFGGHNFAQGFDATFDARGFEVKHEQDGWHARVETRAIRCGDARIEVGAGPMRNVEGEPHRVSMARAVNGAAFEEWAVNGPLGVEQGFTFPSDPCAGRADEIVIEVAVEGMTPAANGNMVALRDDAGNTRATVSALYAQDAVGKVLDGRLAASGETLELRVKVAGAQWPVTIDPIVATQVAKLMQQSTVANAALGTSVAVSGAVALVGAPDGMAGAAYVFAQFGSSWVYQATLTADDGVTNDKFGSAVAMDGQTALVGARYKFGSTSQQGAAYVFVQSGTTWTQQAKLLADDYAAYDEFGSSVSLSNTTALVGAQMKTIGANGRQGAAYVFERSGTTWTQEVKLTGSDGASEDQFGISTALRGTTAVVGASRKTVGGNVYRGAAYVFVRGGTGWSEQAILTASDGMASHGFGCSVAVDGPSALIGSRGAAAAYVFSQSGSLWTEQSKLTPSDADGSSAFGSAVALEGTTALVGAPGVTGGGAAYVFVQSGGIWSQKPKLTAYDRASGDTFGSAVALRGGTAIVGAPNKSANTGAAYGFVGPVSWVQTETLTPLYGQSGDTFGTSVAVKGTTAVVGVPNKTWGYHLFYGIAYVFTRSGAVWSLQAVLHPDYIAGNANRFGASVALDGTSALVGATGVSGIQGQQQQGAAYVFVQNGTAWPQQAVLGATGGAAYDVFGKAVAINGDLAIVGADGRSGGKGAAYVFVRTGATWTQQAELAATGGVASDAFGGSVAISETTAAVGARNKTVGANTGQGAAYVFLQTGATWSQQAQVVAGDGAAGDQFGTSIAVRGTALLVGGPGKTIAGHAEQGAAYVFGRSGTLWTPEGRLTASDGAAAGHLGTSVALDGLAALVGANGSSSQQGAALEFVHFEQPATPFGGGLDPSRPGVEPDPASKHVENVGSGRSPSLRCLSA